VQNFDVQKPVYWEEPQIINQSWKRVQEENGVMGMKIIDNTRFPKLKQEQRQA
jgi:hypothetical protein